MTQEEFLSVYPAVTGPRELTEVEKWALRKVPEMYREEFMDIAQRHAIPLLRLVNRQRRHDAALARFELYGILRKRGLTAVAIGKMVERTPHAIMYGLRQWKRRQRNAKRLRIDDARASQGTCS